MSNHRTRFVSLAGLAVAITLASGPAALASGASGSAGGGGGGTKPPCAAAVSVVATASEALAGNSFSASYTLLACQSRTKVSMTATDLANDAVVWSSPDVIGTTAVWMLPYKLTSYRIDARAWSGVTGATLTAGTTTVATLDELPCTTAITETVTTGYYLVYPAIWNATAAQSCGIPNVLTRLRIRNLSTGLVQYEMSSSAMASVLDFEGPIVAYNTPYEVDADLLSATGSVLATSVAYVTSAPLR